MKLPVSRRNTGQCKLAVNIIDYVVRSREIKLDKITVGCYYSGDADYTGELLYKKYVPDH